MRIAFVVFEFPVVSETFVLNLASAVLDAGHELDILSIMGTPRDAGPHQAVVERYRLMDRHCDPRVPSGIAGRFLGAPRAFTDAWRTHGISALRTLPGFRWSRHALNLRLLYESAAVAQPNYDVIHCQFSNLGRFVLDHRAAGTLRGKLLVHFRGYDVTSELHRVGPRLFTRLFAEADWFVANSRHFAAKAVAAGCPAERLDVIMSGIDLDLFPFRQHLPRTGEPLRLVSVGRMVEKKGLRYVLEALAILRARGIDAELDLVGDGPLARELKYWAASLGIARHARFHGAVPSEAVAHILDAGHLFLAHSVTAANGDQDAPTNTVKEAMAIGLPVVATDHGGYPELIEPGVTGNLVAERDTEALAARIEQLWHSPDAWARLADNARRQVAASCANAVVNPRMLALYERLAGSPDASLP